MLKAYIKSSICACVPLITIYLWDRTAVEVGNFILPQLGSLISLYFLFVHKFLVFVIDKSYHQIPNKSNKMVLIDEK